MFGTRVTEKLSNQQMLVSHHT